MANNMIGIDLGSSNARAAVIKDGRPTLVPGSGGELLTPAVIGYTDDRRFVLGAAAKKDITTIPGVVPSVLEAVAAGERITVGGQGFYPEELAAMMFYKLKKDAESFTGTNVNGAVVVVPSCFTQKQRQTIMSACRMVIGRCRIIGAASAAGLYIKHKGLSDGRKCLVFDLGGGSLDTAVIDTSGDQIDVIAVSSQMGLGGRSLDNSIASQIAGRYLAAERVDVTRNAQAMKRLRDAAEKAKLELNMKDQVNVLLPFITGSAGAYKHLDMTVRKPDIQVILKSMADKAATLAARTVEEAGLKPEHIREVALVGGSSGIAEIRKALTDRFGDKLCEYDRFGAPVLGAAVLAGSISGVIRAPLLLDANPTSFGIEAAGDVFVKMISKNSVIPIQHSQRFSTNQDRQSCIDMNVYQGESEKCSANTRIGNFRLEGIPPLPKGVPQINVEFQLDMNGMLRVSAKDLATGKDLGVMVSTPALSDEQLGEAGKRVRALVKAAEGIGAAGKTAGASADTAGQAARTAGGVTHTADQMREQLERARASHDSVEKQLRARLRELAQENEQLKQENDQLKARSADTEELRAALMENHRLRMLLRGRSPFFTYFLLSEEELRAYDTNDQDD